MAVCMHKLCNIETFSKCTRKIFRHEMGMLVATKNK